ncbi:DinB family protein [Halobacillus yeomjeoni]|uniref:DinB family protein n=1 Tax=Halobacillus yeomjeoni TaxID=311194 RepID=UPI001CD7EE46|nr:DinB family protein [Halobacillus yeomjeoni]MCA0985018.1 DinB family protein [Halobacillus yeomjeoni]
MNMYCQSAFHQIEIVIASISEMIGQLEEEDLSLRPTKGKRSVGELLEHIALIPAADGKIIEEASKEEMESFYKSMHLENKNEILDHLFEHFSILKTQYENYTEEDLQSETTSWWGVTYTRYEWLLQIAAHMYHHRGQLHAMLVHAFNKDPEVILFE